MAIQLLADDEFALYLLRANRILLLSTIETPHKISLPLDSDYVIEHGFLSRSDTDHNHFSLLDLCPQCNPPYAFKRAAVLVISSIQWHPEIHLLLVPIRRSV